jgi:hypothetical protein
MRKEGFRRSCGIDRKSLTGIGWEEKKTGRREDKGGVLFFLSPRDSGERA